MKGNIKSGMEAYRVSKFRSIEDFDFCYTDDYEEEREHNRRERERERERRERAKQKNKYRTEFIKEWNDC